MGYYLKEKNRMKKRGGNKIHKVKKKKRSQEQKISCVSILFHLGNTQLPSITSGCFVIVVIVVRVGDKEG